MPDLKPRGVKAPLHLLPLHPLAAVAGAIEHGAVKYAPWNWQDPRANPEEYLGAALRHLYATADPSQPDLDEESGIHHVAHAGASVVIYLYQIGAGYVPTKLKQGEQS